MGPPVFQARLEADRIVAADSAELPLKRWLPEGEVKAVILGLHGFNDYSNAFAIPAASWARAGIATYAYDQRGFGGAPERGLWPGIEALVADLETAFDLIRARHPETPIFLAGESMGGAVILSAAAAGRVATADGVVLIAPAVRGRETIGVFGRLGLWLSAHTVPWLAGRPPPNLGFQPSDNIEMLRALSRDPLVIKETRIDAFYGLVNLMDDALAAAPRFEREALILLGRRDDLIPDGPTALLLSRMPADQSRMRRVAVYANGYHMLLRDLQAPIVHRDVAAWVLSRKTDPLAALPSGADRGGPPSLADVHRESSGEP
jgi:alpha-beta hydrolase superfamily lysophospholipase